MQTVTAIDLNIGARVLPVGPRQRDRSFRLAGRLRGNWLNHQTIPMLVQRVPHEIELGR